MKSMFYFSFMRMSDDDDDGKYTETIHDCMSCLYFIDSRGNIAFDLKQIATESFSVALT